MTAILYTSKGDKIPVTPQDGKVFSLGELQAFVGGWIEVLPMPDSAKVMVINEEGKLNGLPHNVQASVMMTKFLLPGDYIVGDALVCDRQHLR